MDNDTRQINVVCEVGLYEMIRKHMEDEDGIVLKDISNCSLQKMDNQMGIIIATEENMLLRLMQEAKERQAVMIPVLIADESVEEKPTEPPMLVVERKEFNSEKDLYEFIGHAIESLQCMYKSFITIDMEDWRFVLSEPGRLLFTYVEGKDMESAVNKACDKLANNSYICARAHHVLKIYNANDSDSMNCLDLHIQTGRLDDLFLTNEECVVTSAVRPSSSKNNGLSIWLKI